MVAPTTSGRVRVGDGKDIHHKDNNPRNNSSGNVRVMSAKVNRSKERRTI